MRSQTPLLTVLLVGMMIAPGISAGHSVHDDAGSGRDALDFTPMAGNYEEPDHVMIEPGTWYDARMRYTEEDTRDAFTFEAEVGDLFMVEAKVPFLCIESGAWKTKQHEVSPWHTCSLEIYRDVHEMRDLSTMGIVLEPGLQYVSFDKSHTSYVDYSFQISILNAEDVSRWIDPGAIDPGASCTGLAGVSIGIPGGRDCLPLTFDLYDEGLDEAVVEKIQKHQTQLESELETIRDAVWEQRAAAMGWYHDASGTDDDAGTGGDIDVHSVRPGQTLIGHMAHSDVGFDRDRYAVDVKAGQRVQFSLMSLQAVCGNFEFISKDGATEDFQHVGCRYHESSPMEGAYIAPADGTVYILLVANYFAIELYHPYELSVGELS